MTPLRFAPLLPCVALVGLVLAACEQQQAALTQDMIRHQAAYMESINQQSEAEMAQINRQAEAEMTRINKQVVDDQLDQLKIAMKHGSAIDVCVQAGILTAALLQAKDEAAYAQAKKLERKACGKAGMPQ
jgi:hypothetical protein